MKKKLLFGFIFSICYVVAFAGLLLWMLTTCMGNPGIAILLGVGLISVGALAGLLFDAWLTELPR